MNRLQKKCFVGSAAVHLLLGFILFIGPGFISSRSKPEDDLPILNFVPIKTVDDLVAPGGGNPKAQPPAAAPQPPPQQPVQQSAPPSPVQPQKPRESEPPKETKPLKADEASLETVKERPKKIEISTKLVTRQKDTNVDKTAREEAQAREEAKALADARRRLARQIGRVAERIGDDVSGGTTVELQGPGGGGLPYANWKQAVKSAYENAWLLPDGVVDDEATTAASVTIARDGRVVSSQITRLSGDSVVDRSVQATLDRVIYAAPLPDTAKEPQRTVTIYFNVKSKRSLG